MCALLCISSPILETRTVMLDLDAGGYMCCLYTKALSKSTCKLLMSHELPNLLSAKAEKTGALKYSWMRALVCCEEQDPELSEPQAEPKTPAANLRVPVRPLLVGVSASCISLDNYSSAAPLFNWPGPTCGRTKAPAYSILEYQPGRVSPCVEGLTFS